MSGIKKHGMIGKKHSKKTKLKMSKSGQGKHSREKTWQMEWWTVYDR